MDLADLRREADPQELGQEAGAQGRPPLDAETDPQEQRITAVIEKRLREAAERLERFRTQAQKDCDQTRDKETASVVDLEAISKNTKAAFRTILRSGRDRLKEARNEANKRVRDFYAFRERHGIRREPTNQHSAETRGWLFALLAVLFLVESGLNAAFLQGIVGLVEAWGVAISISVLNLFGTWLFVYAFGRSILHVGSGRRVAALIGTFVWGCLVVALNLLVAHWRDAADTMPEGGDGGPSLGEAGVEALERFAENPLGLDGPQSWLLFGMGCLFAAVAGAEGWTWDDPYPGYGKVHRARREAEEESRTRQNRVDKELEATRLKGMDALARIVRDVKAGPKERRRIAESCRTKIADYDRHIADLCGMGRALVAEYRTVNRQARPDSGSPRCHLQGWKPPGSPIDRTIPCAQGVDRSAAEIREVDAAYGRGMDLIRESHDAAHDELVSFTEMDEDELRSKRDEPDSPE